MGEAKPINVWAGFLDSSGSLEPFVVQGRVPCIWLMSRWKYFASACELAFGEQKNLFVKTELLKNKKLSVERKNKKPTLLALPRISDGFQNSFV